MSRPRTWLYLILWLTISAPFVALAQQPAPPGLPPLFLREEWRQRERPPNAPANFVPEAGVTPAAVTNANLELKLYDPNAKSIAGYEKQPPAGSIARDWSGPACIQLAGYNQNPPPKDVSAGARTDPPNLWTGVCQTPVAATLRDKTNYVDLTGLARIKWVTRVSGFHAVRPVVKLPMERGSSATTAKARRRATRRYSSSPSLPLPRFAGSPSTSLASLPAARIGSRNRT
jgi:hypothetical protein